MARSFRLVLLVTVATGFGGMAVAEEGRKKLPKTPDYNRHVRPILARYCFNCHGRDAKHREAGLRLDTRDGAVKKLESDQIAIRPGRPGDSELMKRIASADADLRMPPADTKKTLNRDEIEILKRWIKAGAPYARHWSFVKPQPPKLPGVKNATWPRSGLDHFILARLEEAGLKPSGPADRYTLIRRLSLDLRGIPPTPQEVQRFIGDRNPGAYNRLVDRFLNDPRYGGTLGSRLAGPGAVCRFARLWIGSVATEHLALS